MYVQLIEPDGTENIKVTYDAAVEYCKNHPGWFFRTLPEDIKNAYDQEEEND